MSELAQSQLAQGVVVACRHPDGSAVSSPSNARWLLVKRADTLSRAPGKVGFPGGAVEPGESQPHAVIREMHEELALRVKPLRCFWQSDTQLPGVPGFILFGWLAELLDSPDVIQPNPAEIQQVLWLTPHQAVHHPDAFTGNADFIAALLRAAHTPLPPG